MTRPAFAVWITGLPSAGKSTITRALTHELRRRGTDAVVLESDALRRVLTPSPTYSDEERDTFYGAMAYMGGLLAERGVPVIFDATANRRSYRAAARERIRNFVEVFVDCPLEACTTRDAKGIYRAGEQGRAATVPGTQALYEPPERADLVVSGFADTPETAAMAIVRMLARKHLIDDGVVPRA
jgi:adenylylsulfate kinase